MRWLRDQDLLPVFLLTKVLQARLEQLEKERHCMHRSPGAEPFSSGLGAVPAQSEDLQIVLHIAESMSFRDLASPALHRRPLDLDRTTAGPADQVVMMAGRATAIGGLAFVGADGVELVSVGHQLQGPVNSGEPDSGALVAQIIVDLACRAELVGSVEDFLDGGTLARSTLRSGHEPLLPSAA